MVTVAFIRCFSCFNWFSYCRGNCICAGQGNTIVSHFVVQRPDLIVEIVLCTSYVPCDPHRSLVYACKWGFWVCWIKPDCSLRLLWSCFLTDSAACVLSFYHSTPLHMWMNKTFRKKVFNQIKITAKQVNNNTEGRCTHLYDEIQGIIQHKRFRHKVFVRRKKIEL